MISKPVELLGDGPREDIEIHARGNSAVLFKAAVGRLAGLTLRQVDPDAECYCVDISMGRLDLEGCDISNAGHACVGVRDGAAPRVRRNQIHDGRYGGILVDDNGHGVIEDNDIIGNAAVGVEMTTGANPVLRRNRTHQHTRSGVLIHLGGTGTVEDNDLTDNAGIALEIATGSTGLVTHAHNRT